MSKGFFLRYIEVITSSFEKWYNIILELLFTDSDYWRIVYWVCITLILVVYLLFKKSHFSKFISRKLLLSSVIIWFVGFVLYIIGYYKKSLLGLAVVPRAFFASLKMFAMSCDISNVAENLREDAIYTMLFMLTHLAAVYLTFVFIFKMVGYKAKSAWRIIRYGSSFKAKNNVVHLFWGVNEASLSLAESISANKRHRKDQLIFIDIDEEECIDCSNKKVTLNRIMNIITIPDEDIERLDKIDALVAHCYDGPDSLSDTNNVEIFKSLNLKQVGKCVRKSREVHCYFLSDNETNNILGALNLQRDQWIQEVIAKQSNEESTVVAYIHARKDSNNEIFAHYSQYDADTKRMKFKLVDSACLAVEQLKRNDVTLPVNCVEVEPHTGCVISPFNALVIGFGGTGQEAFKFLYEYAAFIGTDKRRSPFKCYAIDENMDRIAGYVKEKMPAIRYKDESEQLKTELELINTKVDSELFWEKISEIICSLNYIVISLNDDLVGLSIAVNLFKYALQHRQTEDKVLKILIRCYDHNNEIRMCEVIKNLNNSTKGSNIEIVLFGEEQKIYTYDLIVADKTLKEAKEFNRVYENSPLSAAEQWEINFSNKEITNIMADKNVSRFHAIYDLNRRKAQNYSNSLHAKTKIRLMELAEKDFILQLEKYDAYVRDHIDETTKYTCPAQAEKLLLNMAMVEHERWIAAHKLMGYIFAPKTDLVQKHHQCIWPFEKLTEYTQSFDCKVVNTTIKLEYQKKKEIMKMISAILTLECEDDGLNALKTDILADMNNVVQYLLGKN